MNRAIIGYTAHSDCSLGSSISRRSVVCIILTAFIFDFTEDFYSKHPHQKNQAGVSHFDYRWHFVLNSLLSSTVFNGVS